MCLPGTAEVVRKRVEQEGVPVISRRTALKAGAGGALAAALPKPALAAASRAGRRRRFEDLTHLFREGFPVFAFDPPSRTTLVTVEANGFYSQEWRFHEHSGTHMDAPGHFIAGGRLAPQITLQELMRVRIVVIDISRRAEDDPDAVVTPRDLKRFERRHGRIPNRAGVFMYSGWEKRVNDPTAYKNPDAAGTYHFPGFSIDAAMWLLEKRNITCIGVDTLSIDPGISQTFPVHHAVLGADKYGLENLANLKRIPPIGARAVVGLIPWEEGSGGPCRVIARWEQ